MFYSFSSAFIAEIVDFIKIFLRGPIHLLFFNQSLGTKYMTCV